MNPQPPMNVSTGLGIGVSVVIPSFSRPNIPQMLSSLLLATCMQHDAQRCSSCGSQQSLERAAYIGRETKKLCAGRCDDKKLRHLDLVRLNDKYFVAGASPPPPSTRRTRRASRPPPPPPPSPPRLTPPSLPCQVIVHIDDDVRPHNELLDLMALKVMGGARFPRTTARRSPACTGRRAAGRRARLRRPEQHRRAGEEVAECDHSRLPDDRPRSSPLPRAASTATLSGGWAPTLPS